MYIGKNLHLLKAFSFLLLLLWNWTHCVYSWEHRHPPLWERTCGVCSGNLHSLIPQWCHVNVQCIKGNTFCCHVQVKFWSYSLFCTNILYLLILVLTLLCGQRPFAITGSIPRLFTAIRWSDVTYHTCTRHLSPGTCIITQSKWGVSCSLCLNASHPHGCSNSKRGCTSPWSAQMQKGTEYK